VVGIAVNRSRRDFSERDRLVLDLLRSHLIQAYRNAESVTRMQQDSAYVRQAMDELDRGLIVLAKNGRVLLCTEAVGRSLSEYFEPVRDATTCPRAWSARPNTSGRSYRGAAVFHRPANHWSSRGQTGTSRCG
jgi:hypothetical protein